MLSREGLEKIISPVTLKVNAPEIFRKLLTELEEKLIELHSAPVAFIVTVIPELIVTDSAAVGTAAPPQVAVLFQLPLTLAIRCAKTSDAVKWSKTIRRVILKTTLRFILFRKYFSRINLVAI